MVLRSLWPSIDLAAPTSLLKLPSSTQQAVWRWAKPSLISPVSLPTNSRPGGATARGWIALSAVTPAEAAEAELLTQLQDEDTLYNKGIL